ncbi:MAG: hypothetical protein JO316_01740 [Abitibacteriaceae bacterium]|nr:hypothetical protein [Abditibacteriaceae bacterium]MBV9864048.1 hypothetical protein [Abditibacteriaceae bacterium]
MLIKKQYVQYCLLCLMLLLATHLVLSNIVGDDAREGENVQQHLQALLKDSQFLDIAWNKTFSWQAEHGYVHLPPENVNHPEGVFGVTGLLATTFAVAPLEASCGAGQIELRVLTGEHFYPSENTCKQIALQFLKRHFSWFFETNVVPDPQITGPTNTGVLSFRWEHTDKEGFPTDYVDADVRSIDGKVISFGALKVKFHPLHKITPSQAKQTALQIANKDIQIRNAKVLSFFLDTTADRPCEYHVELQAQERETGQLLTGHISVDGMTGKPYMQKPLWKYADTNHRNSLNAVEDFQPAWTNQGLVFSSKRDLANIPTWASYPTQLMLLNASGKITHLTSDLTVGSGLPSGLDNSSWLTLQRQGWTYTFDLQTGNYKILASPERNGVNPAVNSSGSWGIVCGNGREPSSTIDLFADDLSRPTTMLHHRARLVAPGDQQHPIFSPDGHWLYFITTSESKDKKSLEGKQSLQRIPAEMVEVKKLTQLSMNQVEDVVANLLNPIERLSIFPDGKKLLAQTPKGMSIITVQDKQSKSLALGSLTDNELGAVKIEQVKDGWAGPSDNEVTFSGKTVDKSGKIRWRIYSCHLDGSHVKALTPKDNNPIEPYKFSDGKTAIDLAKEWALSEIAFADAQKRQESN